MSSRGSMCKCFNEEKSGRYKESYPSTVWKYITLSWTCSLCGRRLTQREHSSAFGNAVLQNTRIGSHYRIYIGGRRKFAQRICAAAQILGAIARQDSKELFSSCKKPGVHC